MTDIDDKILGVAAAEGVPWWAVAARNERAFIWAYDVLGCLPGVSTVGARRLLAHFGSLAAVFAADEPALRAVTGIGPVRAAALARLFRAG